MASPAQVSREWASLCHQQSMAAAQRTAAACAPAAAVPSLPQQRLPSLPSSSSPVAWGLRSLHKSAGPHTYTDGISSSLPQIQQRAVEAGSRIKYVSPGGLLFNQQMRLPARLNKTPVGMNAALVCFLIFSPIMLVKPFIL